MVPFVVIKIGDIYNPSNIIGLTIDNNIPLKLNKAIAIKRHLSLLLSKNIAKILGNIKYIIIYARLEKQDKITRVIIITMIKPSIILLFILRFF